MGVGGACGFGTSWVGWVRRRKKASDLSFFFFCFQIWKQGSRVSSLRLFLHLCPGGQSRDSVICSSPSRKSICPKKEKQEGVQSGSTGYTPTVTHHTMFIARIGGMGCRRPFIGGRSVLSWTNTTMARNTPISTSRRTPPTLHDHTRYQTRPFLSWLFNPKEEPIVPKQLNPLKLEDQGSRLLFWDSTYTTPHLKPEFNGEGPYYNVTCAFSSQGSVVMN